MKIKKITIKRVAQKPKRLKTYIKSKTFYADKKNICLRAKKALSLIYQYHVFDKKIMFVGPFLNIEKYIKQKFRKTKHLFIHESLWKSGCLLNNSFFKKTSKFYTDEKICLAVLLGRSNINKSIIDECYKIKIPVVELNSNLNIFNYKSNYKIPNESSSLVSSNNFLFFVMSLFKKGNKVIKFNKRIIKKLSVLKEKNLNNYNNRYYHKRKPLKKKYDYNKRSNYQKKKNYNFYKKKNQNYYNRNNNNLNWNQPENRIPYNQNPYNQRGNYYNKNNNNLSFNQPENQSFYNQEKFYKKKNYNRDKYNDNFNSDQVKNKSIFSQQKVYVKNSKHNKKSNQTKNYGHSNSSHYKYNLKKEKNNNKNDR